MLGRPVAECVGYGVVGCYGCNAHSQGYGDKRLGLPIYVVIAVWVSISWSTSLRLGRGFRQASCVRLQPLAGSGTSAKRSSVAA